MKIFNIVCGAILCALPVTTHADEDCQYFSPALALCTVHAYNVGDAYNPTDSARAADINEVIGLKSTVMVQQLKQQYDMLNATIKRFKTQLEKAVLTSKIEVLTGNTSSSTSSGSSGSSSSNGLSTAEDCGMLSQADVYDCLIRNVAKIKQAAETDQQNARKQLETDLSIATGYEMCGGSKSCRTEITECNKNALGKKDIQNCAQAFNYRINSAKTKFENDRARARWGV